MSKPWKIEGRLIGDAQTFSVTKQYQNILINMASIISTCFSVFPGSTTIIYLLHWEGTGERDYSNQLSKPQ